MSMLTFKMRDKYPLIMGLKWLTLRPLTSNCKGGEDSVLMCERVKGGFAKATLSKPYLFDLRQLNTYWAKALGFETPQDYLKESYNTNNKSYLRKAYIISNIQPNFKNLEGDLLEVAKRRYNYDL